MNIKRLCRKSGHLNSKVYLLKFLGASFCEHKEIMSESLVILNLKYICLNFLGASLCEHKEIVSESLVILNLKYIC